VMGKKKPPAVIVRRRYRADQSSCEEAVRRLLAFAKTEKKGGSDSRPEDAERRSSEIGATDKYTG
jgi:hypothetical protein